MYWVFAVLNWVFVKFIWITQFPPYIFYTTPSFLIGYLLFVMLFSYTLFEKTNWELQKNNWVNISSSKLSSLF